MASTTETSERADASTFEVETNIYTVTPLQEQTETWTIHEFNALVIVNEQSYLPFEVMSEKDLLKLRQSAQRVYDKYQEKRAATKIKRWIWAILVFPFLLLLTYAAYVLLARKANREKSADVLIITSSKSKRASSTLRKSGVFQNARKESQQLWDKTMKQANTSVCHTRSILQKPVRINLVHLRQGPIFIVLPLKSGAKVESRRPAAHSGNDEATPPSLVSPNVSKAQPDGVVWARKRATMRIQNQECLPDSKFIKRGPLVLTKELKGPVKFVSQEKSASEIQIKFDDNLNEIVNIGTCVEVVPEESRATTTVSKDKDTHVTVKDDVEIGEIRTAKTQIRMSGSGENGNPKAMPTEGLKPKTPAAGVEKRQQGSRESKQPRIGPENGQRYAAAEAEAQKLKTAPTEVATLSLHLGKPGKEEKKGPIPPELGETQDVNSP